MGARRWCCAIRTVDAAVLETARGGIAARRAWASGTCDVGAVLNVAADHLGLGGIDTLERARRGQADRRRGRARLRACSTPTTRSCLRWPTTAEGEARSLRHDEPAATSSCASTSAAGGRAVVLEEGVNGQMITLYDGERAHPAAVDAPRSRRRSRARRCTTCRTRCSPRRSRYALGVKLEDIRQGLRTFDTIVLPGAGAHERLRRASRSRCIVDYGHNPRGDDRRWPTSRSASTCTAARIGVLVGARATAATRTSARSRARGAGVRHIILRRDDDLRGRGAGRGRRASWRGRAARERLPADDDLESHPRRADGDRRRAARRRSAGDCSLVFARQRHAHAGSRSSTSSRSGRSVDIGLDASTRPRAAGNQAPSARRARGGARRRRRDSRRARRAPRSRDGRLPPNAARRRSPTDGTNLLARHPLVIVELSLDSTEDRARARAAYLSELGRMRVGARVPGGGRQARERPQHGGAVIAYDAPIDVMLAARGR